MISCKYSGAVLAALALSFWLCSPELANASDRAASTVSIEAYPSEVTAFQTLEGAGAVQGAVLVTLDTGQGTGGDQVEFRAGDRAFGATTVIDHGDGTYSQRLWVGEETGPMAIEALVNADPVPVIATVAVVNDFGGPLDIVLTQFFPSRDFVLAEGSADPINLSLVLFDSFGNRVSPELGFGEQDVVLTPSRGSVSEVDWDFDQYSAAWLPGPESGLGSVTVTVNGEDVDQAFALQVIDGAVGSGAEWVQDYDQLVIYQGSEMDLTVQVLDQNDMLRDAGGDQVIFRARAWGSFIGTVLDHQDGTYSGRFRAPLAPDTEILVFVNGRLAAVTALSFTPKVIFDDRFEG